MYQVAQFYLLNTIFFLKHLSLYILMYCYMCTNLMDETRGYNVKLFIFTLVFFRLALLGG